MVRINTIATATFFIGLGVNALPTPVSKRIAQTISASTTKWVAACQAAGGGQECGTVSQNAFMTLLAAGDLCDHQDAADAMIDLAKTLQNNADIISLAQVFVQQPRNAPDSLAVLYCQKAPKNAELNGLFQCQYQGANQAVFTGNVALGATGTVPFGLTAPLSPPGSCPANPDGPIADGSQLTDITTDPGLANAVGGSDGDDAATTDAPATTIPSPSSAPLPAPVSTASPGTLSGAAGDVSSSNSGSFKKQNGVDAQALNNQFASLTNSSTCTDGENACVGASFAQCVGSKFVLTSCGGGTICAALPLVNSPGTSVACTTAADRDARIATALAS